MEDPPKHDKNNHNNKTRSPTMSPTINIGVGGLGIGGIVLLGGALVAATIVSALALKTRSQRRRSSSDDDGMKKNMSTSPETHNLSDDVTSMKEEMRTTITQTLTTDEKHDCVPSGDSNEDIIVSPVVEDQKNTSIYVDSVFEREEVDDDYEKIDLDSEEQVAMAAQIEADSCLERVDGNENDEHVDANSSVSKKGIVLIEEHEAVEAKATENEDEDHQETVFVNEAVEAETIENEDKDYQETVFMNEVVEAETTENEDKDYQETVFMNEAVAMEAACVNQIKVENNLQVQFLEETEKDCNDEIVVESHLSDETDYADQIKVVNNLQVQFLEKTEKDCDDEIVVENHLSDETDYADQIVHVVMEEATDAASLLQSEDMGEEEEEEVIKAACGNLANMEDNLEIANDEVGHQMQVNQVCETFVVECVMNRLNKEAVDDQTPAKEDAPLTRLMNKEEKTVELVTLEDEMLIKATIVDDQTDNPPRKLMNAEENEEEMITEHELVKKDEIPHVQSVEEDVTVKGELSSDELDMQDELTPAAKISNHKTEEKTIIGEKQAFASGPWNLKLMIWAAVLISVWCLCHWYSELPFAELSLAGSLFILMLLGYRNRTTYALTASFLSKP